VRKRLNILVVFTKDDQALARHFTYTTEICAALLALSNVVGLVGAIE